MNRHAVYGFLLGVLVIGVGILLYLAFVMPPGIPVQGLTDQPDTGKEIPGKAPAPAGVATSQLDFNAPDTKGFHKAPPLFTDPGTGSAGIQRPDTAFGSASNGTGAAPNELQIQKLEQIQDELNQLVTGGQVSPAQVSELISKIRTELGTDTLNGVDLALLQDTVDRAGEIQTLANEIQTLSGKTDEASRQQMNELMTRILDLQQGIPADTSAYGIPETGD